MCFFSISRLFAYMRMRLPSSPRSIAGVPLGRALPGFPITAHHLYAFLMKLEGYLYGDISTKERKRNLPKYPRPCCKWIASYVVALQTKPKTPLGGLMLSYVNLYAGWTLGIGHFCPTFSE